jgi:hypothetical protein
MSAQRELAAMASVASALEGLEDAAVARVLRWAADHFGLPDAQRAGNGGGQEDGVRFADIHALFDAGSPTTDAQRALLAGYWFQVHEGEAAFTGAKINSSLRQMGVGAANIASVFTKMIARKPALVQQVSKSGRAQQARKQYRLTTAGVAAARELIEGNPEV